MCGICGIINYEDNTPSERDLQAMMARMKYRGPDDQGLFIDRNVGFGHVRLSIIDLTSAGHQPMTSSDGRFTISYNGEIYNYLELRSELNSKYQFRTNTDTEVLLYAYSEWGEDCLDRLRGMFAFAIYDSREQRTFIARDRFGIKPLYYHIDGRRLVFASEIPALLSVIKGPRRPDEASIFDYLVFNRVDQADRTFLEDVKRLRHGHGMVVESGREPVVRRWYNLRESIDEPFDCPEDFRENLSDSIKLHLRSDVPVGVCLSGGLDSSSIVSLLIHDHQKTDVHTFSAVYGEGVYGDESEYINEYRDVLSNLHYTQPTGDDLLNKLDLFVKLHGEPTATTSAFAQFKVFELAKEHVVVVLDGQGADELLAGYHYFFGVYLKYLLYKFNLLKFQREVCFNLYNHRSLFGLKSLLYFALPVSMKTSTMMRDRSHLANDFAQTLKSTSTVANDLYECTSLREALINHFEFKLEHLLKNEDRNSMYFSIESRVPFLDHKLVERTLALDGDQVIHNGMTKYILRRAMKGVMPEKIRMRQGKLGFATPESQWLRSENFREFILDVFHSSSFAQRGYFNQENAIELYEQHYEGKVNKSKEIWKLLNLELWHRAFLDSN